MNKQAFINKWEDEYKKWRKVIDENALFHTKEEKTKAVCFMSVISLVLKDAETIDLEEEMIEELEEELREINMTIYDMKFGLKNSGFCAWDKWIDLQIVEKYNKVFGSEKTIYIGIAPGGEKIELKK